jgi:hypothetical protein
MRKQFHEDASDLRFHRSAISAPPRTDFRFHRDGWYTPAPAGSSTPHPAGSPIPAGPPSPPGSLPAIPQGTTNSTTPQRRAT